MNDQPGRFWTTVLVLTTCGMMLMPMARADASPSPGLDEQNADETATASDEASRPRTDDTSPKVDAEGDADESSEGNAAGANRPLTEEERLIREAKALLEEVRMLRQQLAESELARAELQRELDELRQFIADHHEYGRDFEEYQRIREVKQQEEEERQRREARERYQRERQKRLEQQERVREARLERRAAERKEREYQRHGFEPIGLDVFVGRTAYQYRIRDTLRTRITYDPFFGFFTRRDYRDRIDFTEMTLSGAVINASDEIRNIGIAITFFDGGGSQVGHEIVQINNARPDVPYPFTSTVSMALDRPFTTSSSYVLFADPADVE